MSRDLTICGGKGIRTPDLLHAMETRYQLRHTPASDSQQLSCGARAVHLAEANR